MEKLLDEIVLIELKWRMSACSTLGNFCLFEFCAASLLTKQRAAADGGGLRGYYSMPELMSRLCVLQQHCNSVDIVKKAQIREIGNPPLYLRKRLSLDTGTRLSARTTQARCLALG